MADGYNGDETAFSSFARLEKNTGIDRRHVRLACRSLTRKGLAEYARGLTNSEGEMAGAGYGPTKKGAALITPCDKCTDLAVYDWWEKDGVQVYSLPDCAVHVQLCEVHYQDLKIPAV